MTEIDETIHVVFGLSSANTIRRALSLLGRTERVVGLTQGLYVGPINPPDLQVRDAWGRSVLGAKFMLPRGLDGVPASVEKAWAEATTSDAHSVFWVAKHSPSEHACFLAFASHMRKRNFDIVDGTDLNCRTVSGASRLWCLGLMRPKDVIASRILERRRNFASEERDAAAEAWSRLQLENSPFRIVRDRQLVSAPLTHYDALLVRSASPDWEIAPRLIGRAMTTFWDAPNGDGAGDAVLFGRMLALGETGSLEVSGLGPTMSDFQVRRPSPAAHS